MSSKPCNYMDYGSLAAGQSSVGAAWNVAYTFALSVTHTAAAVAVCGLWLADLNGFAQS